LAEQKNYEEESRNHDKKSQPKKEMTTTGKNHKGEREKSVLSAVCCISKCSAGCENWFEREPFSGGKNVFVREAYASNCDHMHMPTGVGTQESAHAHKPRNAKSSKIEINLHSSEREKRFGRGGITMTSICIVNILHLRQRD
jgi:hypothetical protein